MYSKILIALDGSEFSLKGGEVAASLAQGLGSEIVAAHIYDAGLHNQRFREMEPVLPAEYQEEGTLNEVREAHGGLIYEGFEALSKGYMEQFVAAARERGISITQVFREGRNYIKLLEIARETQVNLITLGAHGLGDIRDGHLGSTALRTLRMAPCDVLIVRRNLGRGKVIVAIDGSNESLGALRKGVVWSQTLTKPLQVVAVYDPLFHQQVFKTMAESLSAERREEVGLSKQESLHDQLIDEGLKKLYQTFLDQALERCNQMGMEAETVLLKGKIYRTLIDHAQRENADLVVMGRFGHHHEDIGDIGSNSEAVGRLASVNVLLTEKVNDDAEFRIQGISSMDWEEDALKRLEGIPSFARSMAQQGIENHVRSKGGKRVTLKDVQEVAHQLGMKDHRESEDA